MFDHNSTKTNFSYDIEYDDLVTRNAYVAAQISTEEFPKKIWIGWIFVVLGKN